MPTWFLSPPSDDDSALYGVGDGQSREAATESALSNLAGKLGTDIQAHSRLISTRYASAYRYNEEVNQHTVEATIRKITLNQYQLVESKQIGYQRFVALVRSDKRLLAASLQKALDERVSRYETAQKALSSAPGLRRLQFFEKEQLELGRFRNNLAALSTLRGTLTSVRDRHYRHYINDVITGLAVARQETVFHIHANPGPEYIRKALEDRVLQAGFKIAQSPAEATDVIHLITSLEASSAYGLTVLRQQIQLNLSEDGQPLGGNLLSIKGQGVSQKQAHQDLSESLKKQLQRRELKNVLGIE